MTADDFKIQFGGRDDVIVITVMARLISDARHDKVHAALVARTAARVNEHSMLSHGMCISLFVLRRGLLTEDALRQIVLDSLGVV